MTLHLPTNHPARRIFEAQGLNAVEQACVMAAVGHLLAEPAALTQDAKSLGGLLQGYLSDARTAEYSSAPRHLVLCGRHLGKSSLLAIVHRCLGRLDRRVEVRRYDDERARARERAAAIRKLMGLSTTPSHTVSVPLRPSDIPDAKSLPHVVASYDGLPSLEGPLPLCGHMAAGLDLEQMRLAYWPCRETLVWLDFSRPVLVPDTNLLLDVDLDVFASVAEACRVSVTSIPPRLRLA